LETRENLRGTLLPAWTIIGVLFFEDGRVQELTGVVLLELFGDFPFESACAGLKDKTIPTKDRNKTEPIILLLSKFISSTPRHFESESYL
jgi:hypothetical protein